MHSDYQIEDLVYQNENLVVYRVSTTDGTPLAVVRLRYEEDIVERLKGDRFENALQELQSLNHSCLRPVLNGGLDPVDSSPWVAVRWWDGILLTDRIKNGPKLTQEEFDRIKNHGTNLIETLGPVVSTVSFTPSSVVTCGSDPASLIDTFSIDYHAWFHAFAHDIHPATLSASYQKLADLLEYLRRHTLHSPATLVTPSGPATTTQRSTLTHAPSNLSQPSSTVALPSATKSSFPLKTLLFVATLLIGIGAGLWFMNREKNIARQPPAIIADSPPPQEKAKSAITPQPDSSRPERPKLDIGHEKIEATNPASIKKNIGKWVEVSGIISDLTPQDRLVFESSSLRAALPPSSKTTAENALGNSVTIQGFLESEDLLEVQDQADIKISYLLKDTYSVKDEAQLRGMKGQFVTLEAEALEFTQSGSGATLYLQLHTSKPEFAIGFQKSKLEAGLDEAFIKSLIGKKIKYKGQLKIDGRGNRLSIVITKKSQISSSE